MTLPNPSWPVVLVIVVAASLSACILAPPIIQNVHHVVPGVVVRSAQLSPERLAELIASHKIRSVLNLRGPSPGESWYDDERAVTARKKVEHFDFPMSSREEVPRAQADALIELMKRAPKPMLIHCWGGADRTGLASALYLYAIKNQEAERAAAALSFKYHHLSFTSAGAMDRSFKAFVGAGARKLEALVP